MWLLLVNFVLCRMWLLIYMIGVLCDVLCNVLLYRCMLSSMCGVSSLVGSVLKYGVYILMNRCVFGCMVL